MKALITMMFDVCGECGWIGCHVRAGGDGTEITKIYMKRFRSAHLGRVIDYHVMMYCSRYEKARSVFQILSILCVTSIIDYETLEECVR